MRGVQPFKLFPAVRATFDAWWGPLTRQGDPERRPHLTEEAYQAGYIAGQATLAPRLKEMGDWLSAGLQASKEAWPDARCLQETEEIFGRARDALDAAESLAHSAEGNSDARPGK